MPKITQKLGFTLLEMMVAILLIAILLGVGGPIYTSYTVKSRFAEVFSELSQYKNDLEAAYFDNDEFPSEVAGLAVATYNAVSSNVLQQIYYGVSTDSQDAYMHFFTLDLGISNFALANSSGANGTSCRISLVAVTTATGNTQFYCGQWNGTATDVPLTYLPRSCQDTNLQALIS